MIRASSVLWPELHRGPSRENNVFGCFKFKVTFHNVFSFKWVLISILICDGFVEYHDHFWQQSMLNWVLLKTV